MLHIHINCQHCQVTIYFIIQMFPVNSWNVGVLEIFRTSQYLSTLLRFCGDLLPAHFTISVRLTSLIKKTRNLDRRAIHRSFNWNVRITLEANYMMTWWNGNIFRVTDPLCGEFTGHQRRFDFFICAWINGWVNNREADDFEAPSRSLCRHCNDTGSRFNIKKSA